MMLLIVVLGALIGATLTLAVRARDRGRAEGSTTGDPFWERELDELDWEHEAPSDPDAPPRYRTPLV